MAAGLEVERDDRDVLADVLQVFGADTGLQWPVLAERLDARIPDRWADTTGRGGQRRVPGAAASPASTSSSSARRARAAAAPTSSGPRASREAATG